MLHHDHSGGGTLVVCDIAYTELHKVIRTQFAVHGQIEQRKLARATARAMQRITFGSCQPRPGQVVFAP